ncbi:MAG: hypothetical protein AB7Q45_11550 [Planctomycetaceae bacterium]
MPRLKVFRLFVVWAGGVLPGGVEAQDAAVPTMDEIIAAARQRQAAVSSGKFEWTVKRWLRKGIRGDASLLGGESGHPNPPEDMDFSAVRMLIFSGANVRYESFGPEWNAEKKAYTPFRLTTTWDGNMSKRFEDPEGFWNGRIQNKPWFVYLTTFEPLSWTYRMLDEDWARLAISDFSVRPTLEDVGGEACIVVERSRPSRATPDEPMVDRMWLSRERGYLVRRYESGRGTWVGTRIDIEYENSPEGIPVPIRWTKVQGLRSDPPPGEISDCELTKYELNIPFDSATFELTFPPTTWVQEQGVAEPYIVHEDGLHRPITKAELRRGATYADLLVTASGQAKLTPLKTSPYVWLFWTVQAVLAAAILCYLYRKRCRRDSN